MRVFVFKRAGDFVDVEAFGHGIEDFFVHTSLVIQIIVFAMLGHHAVFQYIGVISIDDLRQAVRNHDDGAALFDGIER